MISCQVLFCLSMASMASCWATVDFQIVICCHTSSPSSQSGRDRIQKGIFHCFPFCWRFGGFQWCASSVSRLTSPETFPCHQSISGRRSSKNGYPRMMSLMPMFARKKLCLLFFPQYHMVISHACRISPALFGVPSTFRTFLGF
jgi:hypothetical protein